MFSKEKFLILKQTEIFKNFVIIPKQTHFCLTFLFKY